MELQFRTATLADLPEMKQLFADTIMEVCKKDYTERQRQVWSSSVNKTQRWLDVINEQYVLLAIANRVIAGYATLKENNYIDFFYVHKDFQNCGIANALLKQLEQKAKDASQAFITSDISITARPFFEKQGFEVIARQENIREDVVLINYKMRKNLL